MIKYLPEQAIPTVVSWFKEYQFHLRVTKQRSTKLGDFRPAQKNKPNRISVNGDLNPYHFLITLTHEVAHASVWLKHRNKVAPHGIEWKNEYSQLLNVILQKVDFPDQLIQLLQQHINRPKASSCSDPELYKALKSLDADPRNPFLEEIDEQEFFILGKNRIFKKGKKRRTRYECIDQSNGKKYLVSAHAAVQPIEQKRS